MGVVIGCLFVLLLVLSMGHLLVMFESRFYFSFGGGVLLVCWLFLPLMLVVVVPCSMSLCCLSSLLFVASVYCSPLLMLELVMS